MFIVNNSRSDFIVNKLRASLLSVSLVKMRVINLSLCHFELYILLFTVDFITCEPVCYFNTTGLPNHFLSQPAEMPTCFLGYEH